MDNEEKVKLILQDPEIHLQDFPMSPLFSTIMTGNVKMAQLLLEEGHFDLHWDNDHLLHTAITIQEYKMIQLFWNYMTEEEKSDTFKWTLGNGSCEMVSFMLKELGADPTKCYAFLMSLDNYLPDNECCKITKLLLEDGRADPSVNNSIAFSHAVVSKKFDIVRLFLEDRRIDPSTRNNAFLWLTVMSAEPADDLVMLFLSYPSVVAALPKQAKKFFAETEEFGGKLQEMSTVEFARGFEALHQKSLSLNVPVDKPKEVELFRKLIHIYFLNSTKTFYRKLLGYKVAGLTVTKMEISSTASSVTHVN